MIISWTIYNTESILKLISKVNLFSMQQANILLWWLLLWLLTNDHVKIDIPPYAVWVCLQIPPHHPPQPTIPSSYVTVQLKTKKLFLIMCSKFMCILAHQAFWFNLAHHYSRAHVYSQPRTNLIFKQPSHSNMNFMHWIHGTSNWIVFRLIKEKTVD